MGLCIVQLSKSMYFFHFINTGCFMYNWNEMDHAIWMKFIQQYILWLSSEFSFIKRTIEKWIKKKKRIYIKNHGIFDFILFNVLANVLQAKYYYIQNQFNQTSNHNSQFAIWNGFSGEQIGCGLAHIGIPFECGYCKIYNAIPYWRMCVCSQLLCTMIMCKRLLQHCKYIVHNMQHQRNVQMYLWHYTNTTAIHTIVFSPSLISVWSCQTVWTFIYGNSK